VKSLFCEREKKKKTVVDLNEYHMRYNRQNNIASYIFIALVYRAGSGPTGSIENFEESALLTLFLIMKLRFHVFLSQNKQDNAQDTYCFHQ
jgi:hypothetical protein